MANTNKKLSTGGYRPTSKGYKPEKNQSKDSSKLPKGGSGENYNKKNTTD